MTLYSIVIMYICTCLYYIYHSVGTKILRNFVQHCYSVHMYMSILYISFSWYTDTKELCTALLLCTYVHVYIIYHSVGTKIPGDFVQHCYYVHMYISILYISISWYKDTKETLYSIVIMNICKSLNYKFHSVVTKILRNFVLLCFFYVYNVYYMMFILYKKTREHCAVLYISKCLLYICTCLYQL